MNCFDQGHAAGMPEEAVRSAFSHFAADSESDHWRLRYDKANSCIIDVTRLDGTAGLISGLTLHRPCADPRLWDSIYRVMIAGQWVLFFPSEKPPIIVANSNHVKHMPVGMAESLGPVQVARSGQDVFMLVQSR